MNFIMLPEGEWEGFKEKLEKILSSIETLKHQLPEKSSQSEYITAKEFMEAVRIKRTKFDQMVAGNKIKMIKKSRKIYVPITEIRRYFNDSNI